MEEKQMKKLPNEIKFSDDMPPVSVQWKRLDITVKDKSKNEVELHIPIPSWRMGIEPKEILKHGVARDTTGNLHQLTPTEIRHGAKLDVGDITPLVFYENLKSYLKDSNVRAFDSAIKEAAQDMSDSDNWTLEAIKNDLIEQYKASYKEPEPEVGEEEQKAVVRMAANIRAERMPWLSLGVNDMSPEQLQLYEDAMKRSYSGERIPGIPYTELETGETALPEGELKVIEEEEGSGLFNLPKEAHKDIEDMSSEELSTYENKLKEAFYEV